MRTSRANRRHHTQFDGSRIPELMNKLEKSNISYNDLQNGISLFQKLSTILSDLEIKLPPLCFKSEENEEKVESESDKFVNQLHFLRKLSIALLHGKQTDEYEAQNLKKRKISVVAPSPVVENNSTFPSRKMARTLNRQDGIKHLASKNRPRMNQSRFSLLDLCYVCKTSLVPGEHSPRVNQGQAVDPKGQVRHDSYPWMCTSCGDLNLRKRTNSADLSGKVSLVTGGRIKIGYEIVLKLLRANAKTVIMTTRFPADAYKRFQEESDFSVWSSRLRIYRLDLRFLGEVNSFCEEILKNFAQLDILIQNAAQTIRRPTAYYKELVKSELELPANLTYFRNQLLPLNQDDTISTNTMPETVERSLTSNAVEGVNETEMAEGSMTSNTIVPAKNLLPPHPTQLLVHPEDFKFATNTNLCQSLFPIGRMDEDGNQLDLRKKNTWILDLEEVDAAEMVEVSLVNYMAPFVILKSLTPLMTRAKRNWNKDLGFVVLVSAMEGKFNSFKTGKHPHTNAAKAALNMLVRTSAKHYYKKHGLLLNAVDTGWVTDEHPVGHACRLEGPPPLDCVDGAARVLDPIFEAINHPETFAAHGKFFKDYRPTTW